MSQRSVKILVCCHKDDVRATSAPYLPLQVGKEISAIDLKMQGDNEGENISAKNKTYCELTGMYWAWKNLKHTDIIGLCHYRRYFDFHHISPMPDPIAKVRTERFESLDLSIPESVLEKVELGKIVVSTDMHFPYPVFVAYCVSHYSDDIRTLRDIIRERCEHRYSTAFDKVIYKSNKLSPYNMFIMRWSDFDAYCSWLFDILSEAEQRIDISSYSDDQKRIWGYMAERLFNVWLLANGKQTIKKSVVLIEDNNDRPKCHLRMVLHNLKLDFCNRLIKIKPGT